MSLEDLTRHIHDQTSTINENNYGFHDSATVDLTRWIALRDSLWGEELTFLGDQELASLEAQGLESLKARGLASSEVEDLAKRPLQDVTPTTSPVVKIPETMPPVWDLDNQCLLVRSEYEKAERAAVSENAHNIDVFLVTGQTGIGKTAFLVWLLMRRLSLRLPTVLQYDSSKVVLFHEGGVSQFRYLEDILSVAGLRPPPHSSGRIWALVDSNNHLTEPAPIFRMRGPFFVVEATPPCQSRLKWANKVNFTRFYMKQWAFPEVLQARPFLGLSCRGPYTNHQLWHLYHMYGAPPRELSAYAHEPAAYERRVAQEIRQMRPDVLRYALQSPECVESDLIMAIEPLPSSPFTYQRRVISPHVLEMLWAWYTETYGSRMTISRAAEYGSHRQMDL